MTSRIENMMNGGRSDAGLSTMELVVYLAIAAVILAGGAVALYFTLNANAQENNASSAGLAAHTAIQAMYADYGAMPADAAAVDGYLTSVGDNTIGTTLPSGATIEVYPAGTGAENNTVTVVESTNFDDVIVIDGTGQVTKTPSASFTAPTGTASYSW